MPLNQSQRDEIENSIAHFFYGLATNRNELNNEITALKLALDKALMPAMKPNEDNEEKEREEKYTPPETRPQSS